MASWLSGSLQKVSGGLTSITGQLSSFTKEVLKEGTEEIHDAATELRIAQQKIKDLEMTASIQKKEWDRMKNESAEQTERAEAAELQIASISKEYRSLLQEKSNEVGQLKQQLEEMKEQHASLLQHSTFQSAPSHVAASDGSMQFNGDDISAQMEVNRLSSEVERLKAQLKHRKEMVENRGEVSTGGDLKDENVKLVLELETVKEELRLQVDQQQSYLVALQNAHSEKLESVSVHYQKDLAELNETVRQLKAEVAESNSCLQEEKGVEFQAALQAERERVSSLESEKCELVNQLALLQGNVDRLERESREYQETSLETEVREITKENDEVDCGPSAEVEIVELKKQMTAQLAQANADLQMQSEENAFLQDKTIELKTACNDLQQRLQAKDDEDSKADKKMAEQMRQLEGDCTAANERNQTLEERLGETERTVGFLEEEKSLLAKKCNELEESKEVSEEELASLKRQVSELSQAKVMVEGESARLRGESEDLAKEKAEIEGDLLRVSEQRKFRDEAFAALQRERDEIDERVRQLEGKVEEVQTESEKTEREMGERLRDAEAQKRTLEKQIQIKNSEVEVDLQQEEKQKSFAESESEMATLRVQQESNIEKLKSYEAHFAQLQAALQQYEHFQGTYRQNMQTLQSEVSRLNGVVSQRETQLETLERERNAEVERLRREMAVAAKERDRLATNLREKEMESGRLQEEVKRIVEENARGKESSSSLRQQNGQLLDALADSRKKLAEMGQERALLDEDSKAREKETRILQAEIVVSSKTSQATAERSGRELERLRAHLLEVEDLHTREAIHSQEREADLLQKLSECEEQVRKLQQYADERGQFVHSQLENLQGQLHSVCTQRDGALSQLNVISDDLRQKTAQLTNLQSVLEQFQAEQDGKVALAKANVEDQMGAREKEIGRLKELLAALQQEVVEARSAAEMSAALQAEIDNHKASQEKQRADAMRMETSLKVAVKHIEDLKRAEVDRVEKALIKNMLMGYLTGPKGSQEQVLRLMASILSFSQEESDKVLTKKSGWLSSLWSRSTKNQNPSNVDGLHGSFSEMFVHFLEEESKPKGKFIFTPPSSPSRPSSSRFQAINDRPISTSTPKKPSGSTPDQPMASESSETSKPWKTNVQPVKLAGSSFQLLPTSGKNPDSSPGSRRGSGAAQALALQDVLGYQSAPQ